LVVVFFLIRNTKFGLFFFFFFFSLSTNTHYLQSKSSQSFFIQDCVKLIKKRLQTYAKNFFLFYFYFLSSFFLLISTCFWFLFLSYCTEFPCKIILFSCFLSLTLFRSLSFYSCVFLILSKNTTRRRRRKITLSCFFLFLQYTITISTFLLLFLLLFLAKN
jgi:hypothetical protein